MKKYAGYGFLLLAFAAGLLSLHPVLIPILALIATLVFASQRKALDKGSTHSLKKNPLIEGAFLFVLQCLIIFVVYYLGYFLAETLLVKWFKT